MRTGVSILDVTTGTWMALGILTALLERQRSGKGQRVDASLFKPASCSWHIIWFTGSSLEWIHSRKARVTRPSRRMDRCPLATGKSCWAFRATLNFDASVPPSAMRNGPMIRAFEPIPIEWRMLTNSKI